MSRTEADITGDEFFLQMEKQAATGKRIVQIIVITSYVFLAFDFISSIIIGNFSVLTLGRAILWSIFYYKLYIGRSWARWLYIVGCALGILLLAGQSALLLDRHMFGDVARGLAANQFLAVVLWIAIAAVAVQITFCVLLLASKSVHEFLYRQDAGG